MGYTLKVRTINVVNETNDVVVLLISHLTDDFGIPFRTSSNTIDSFTIRVPKSSLPGTVDLAFLTGLAEDQIAIKYNKTLTAQGSDGSDVLFMSEIDVSGLFIDLLVDGPGLTASANLDSIIGTTEIQLDTALTLDFTGNTTAPSFTVTGDTTISTATITGIADTSNIENGMFIAGAGIPAGSTVSSVISGTSVQITQLALATASGVTMTLETDSDSAFLDSLSPANFDTRYIGLPIEGPSLELDTTILGIESTSKIELSRNATATSVGGAYTISSGQIPFTFDTSGLTIDFTDLQRVVDIIDFSAL